MKQIGWIKSLIAAFLVALLPGISLSTDVLIWKQVAMVSRTQVASAVLNGNLYYIGGIDSAMTPSDTVGKLNLATGLAGLGTPLGLINARSGACAVACGSTLYVIGGENSKTMVLLDDTMNLNGNLWSNFNATTMNIARVNFGAVVIDNKIYAFGGLNAKSMGDAQMEVTEDLATGLGWDSSASSLLANMNVGRWRFAYAEVNGRIYVMGGQNGAMPAGALASVEIYDPVADTWTYGPSMPKARAGGCAAAINGKIFVFPGQPASPSEAATATVFVLDTATNQWTTITPIVSSGNPSQYDRSAVVYGNKIYLVGGMGFSMATAGTIDEVSILDPSVNAPNDGKMQIRNNIINVNRTGARQNMKAYILIKGTAGKSFTLAVYSRAGLWLGDIVTNGVIGSDGSVVVIFDGTVASGKKLNSGSYWIVGGGGVKDRQPIMVINEN